MKLFLQHAENIRIIHDTAEWQGTLADFMHFEPAYPGLPVLTTAPAVVRYQTPDQKYIEDSNGKRSPDMFDALPYCDNIGAYTHAGPLIYVSALLDKRLLLANVADDVLQAVIELRATTNPADPVLPVTAVWPITLRDKVGAIVDNILLPFDQGVCIVAYRYVAGLPLGEYRIDAADFDPVEFGGVTYRVDLAAPVSFTISRQLEQV